MTRSLTLTAALASTAPARLSLTAANVAVDLEARTITAVIAPYGPVGYTNMGPTVYRAGFLDVPDPISRVKLLTQHDQQSPAVGVGTLFTDSDSSASMTFYLPPGIAGDSALADADEGLRDGVSIGCSVTEWAIDENDNLVVLRASLYEVSLVTIPAFEDARVLDVAAARKDLPTVTLEALRAELAAGRITQAEFDVQAARLAPPAAPAAQPAIVAAAAATDTPGQPQAPPVIVATRAQGMTLTAAAQATLAHLRQHGTEGLAAALSDIIVNDESGATSTTHRPTFIGELWTATNVRRPLIDAMTSADLTGVKVYGWRWVEGPEVTEYAGKKTDVPSNEWKMETAEADAQPFAGGWDVERKYIDLGAAGLIEVAYARATDSYMLNSEAYAARMVLAGATSVPAQSSLVAALAEMGSRAAAVGANISYVQFSPSVWAEFVNLKASEVPWWLRSQGQINLSTTDGEAGAIRFSVNPALTGRQLLAGDGRASTWYELAVPIRVRAENIPQGGVDLGVFGYGAIIINDPRAIFKTTVSAAVSTPANVMIVNTSDAPVITSETAAGA